MNKLDSQSENLNQKQNFAMIVADLAVPMALKQICFISAIFFSCSMQAQVNFSEQEIKQNQMQSGNISQVAAQCLDGYHEEQISFFNRWKMTKFYGNRRPDYASRAGRIKAMQREGVSASEAAVIADQQRGTACITMVMDCLGRGFAAAGMGFTWQKIYRHLAEGNRFEGTDLQLDLHRLGWKIYYWSPNPSQNRIWDEEDRRLNPLKPGKKWMGVWGGHEERFREVQIRGTYYGIPVDNARELVGFGDRPPQLFAQIPFFVGTAHAGYHVFPGRQGQVIEAHSTRDIGSVDNIQYSLFNPLGENGGPRWTAHERYRSGLIAVPPGF